MGGNEQVSMVLYRVTKAATQGDVIRPGKFSDVTGKNRPSEMTDRNMQSAVMGLLFSTHTCKQINEPSIELPIFYRGLLPIQVTWLRNTKF